MALFDYRDMRISAANTINIVRQTPHTKKILCYSYGLRNTAYAASDLQ